MGAELCASDQANAQQELNAVSHEDVPPYNGAQRRESARGRGKGRYALS
jgi:hypothetical protein